MKKLNKWFNTLSLTEQIIYGLLMMIGVMIALKILPTVIVFLFSMTISLLSTLLPLIGVLVIVIVFAILGLSFYLNRGKNDKSH